MQTPIELRAFAPRMVSLTFTELQRARIRRERLVRYGAALAAIVLPSLLAWVTVGYVLGAL